MCDDKIEAFWLGVPFSRAAWKEKVKDAESHFTQESSEASQVSEIG